MGVIFFGDLVFAKRIFIIIGITIPILAHVVTALSFAYGGYDGEHCAGLLDAVWKCTEFEYYLDWLFNPLVLMALFGYFFISAVLTPIAWFVYKKI
jgi:hypothetical protein